MSANLSRAERDVLSERGAQRAKWGDSHDDEHETRELALVADELIRSTWPAGPLIDRWGIADGRNDRARLVVAAALLIAEVDRLDRAAAALAPYLDASARAMDATIGKILDGEIPGLVRDDAGGTGGTSF